MNNLEDCILVRPTRDGDYVRCEHHVVSSGVVYSALEEVLSVDAYTHKYSRVAPSLESPKGELFYYTSVESLMAAVNSTN